MSETPITPANVFKEDGVHKDTDSNFLERHWWDIFVVIGLIIITLVIGNAVFQHFRLPPAFKVVAGDTMIARTDGDMWVAITVASRIKRPVIVTLMCGASHTTFAGHTCGVPFESVDYIRLHELVKKTDTVRMEVRLNPGDIVDARRRLFVSGGNTFGILRYYMNHGVPSA